MGDGPSSCSWDVGGRVGSRLLVELVAEVPDSSQRRNSKLKVWWLWLCPHGHRAHSGVGLEAPGGAFPCPALPA